MSGGAGREPKLLNQVRRRARAQHLSLSTEKSYVSWIRRYILYHGKRHPQEIAEPEINAFLTHLAVDRHVSASTQNQALSALLFLYRAVLGKDLGDFGDIIRARRRRKMPVVLTRGEVGSVLEAIDNDKDRLILQLLYGTGMRLREGLRLRVKDVDFSYNQITVRDGKGFKDRVTMLPELVKPPLAQHLKAVRALHQRDLKQGRGRVYLPYALARKYPAAPGEWGWQFVFPAPDFSRDPRSGLIRRHHRHERALQRSFKRAVKKARIVKAASIHTLRHNAESRIMPSRGRKWPGISGNSAVPVQSTRHSPRSHRKLKRHAIAFLTWGHEISYCWRLRSKLHAGAPPRLPHEAFSENAQESTFVDSRLSSGNNLVV